MQQSPSLLARVVAVVAAVLVAAASAHAQNYFWNPANTAGDWDTSTAIWGTTAGGPYTSAWVNGSNAPALSAATGGTTATLATAIVTDSIFYSGTFTVAAGSGSLTINDGSTLSGVGGSALLINTPVLGASQLTFDQTGTGVTRVYLSGNNSFSNGLTVLNNVRLAVGNSGTSFGTVQTGTLTGDVSLQPSPPGTSTLAFESTQTYAGVVSGSGDLEVVSPTGSGTVLTLTNSQNIFGTVIVRDRSTLRLENDGSSTFGSVASATHFTLGRTATLDTSAVTNGTWLLANAQTLVVSGNSATTGSRIVGAVEVAGTLSLMGEAGTSTGVLRKQGGNLKLLAASTWQANIKTWTGGTPGTDFSQIVGVSGAKLDLTDALAGSPIRIDIRGESLTGFDAGTARSWVIADFSDGNSSGGVLGFNANNFTLDTSNFGQSLGEGFFTVTADSSSNTMSLNFVPVPEPMILVGLAAVAGLFLRRCFPRSQPTVTPS